MTSVDQVAIAISDLDFNVTEGEIEEATNIWNNSANSNTDYQEIRSSSHPM